MKKTKNIKAVLITAFITFSVFVSVRMIKQDYKFLRVEYLNHAKGQTQHFINSFIN